MFHRMSKWKQNLERASTNSCGSITFFGTLELRHVRLPSVLRGILGGPFRSRVEQPTESLNRSKFVVFSYYFVFSLFFNRLRVERCNRNRAR